MYKGKRKIGQVGEETAKNYLISEGFILIQTNFKSKFGEIDIICEKNKTVYFVEVKFRNSNEFGTGAYAINKNKIRHIRNTAEVWITQNKSKYPDYNYDFLALVIENDQIEIFEFD
jgi:putative endonuclease